MDYQSVQQNPMEEFDDLDELEENREEGENEGDGEEVDDDIEKGVTRPSLLFTQSMINRRTTVYNLHQVL